MTRPTLFGMNGNNAMVGGEAGAEAILSLTQFWNTLKKYLKPQKAVEQKPSITNYIDVKVYSNNEDDDTLANKVAARIVEVIENMQKKVLYFLGIYAIIVISGEIRYTVNTVRKKVRILLTM